MSIKMFLLKNVLNNLRNKHAMNKLYKNSLHRSSCLLGEGENVREYLFCSFQKEPPKPRRKISLIGAAGHTGSILAYTLLCENYCDEIVMVDLPEEKDRLLGQILDCAHSSGLYKNPKIIMCTNYENTKDSDVVVFNAGLGVKKGHSRLELLQDNVNIFAKMVPTIAKLSPKSVFLVVANPADVMAYTCWRYSAFDRNRIISTGTELDSARFRYNLAQRLKINPVCINGWILGEHGDSSVAAWSTVNVAGTKLREIDPDIGTKNDKNDWNKIHQQVIKDGMNIHVKKGCTDFGVSRTANGIIRSVLQNSRMIHSVSTQLTGLYGIKTEVFMSFPCVIGNMGVSEIVQLCLDDEEIEKLNKSASLLQKAVDSVNFP